jgi:hypothetical protein
VKSVKSVSKIRVLIRSKKIKKALTRPLQFVIFEPHTVTIKQKQNMRTKILLGAAAALAASLVSSQAQVYSANVVGYVNVVYPAGQFVMSANPLTTGNDVLTNVLSGVPGSTTLNYWTGSGFVTYTYSAPQHKWLNGSVDVSSTPVPPGIGFFITAGGAGFTNTYVGSVAAQSGGGTTTNTLVSGLQPVGEQIPYSDVVTNTATVNLTVPGATVLQIWNVGSQSYDSPYTYSAPQKVWKQNSATANPSVQPGEGFFINPPSGTNWVQTLQ